MIERKKKRAAKILAWYRSLTATKYGFFADPVDLPDGLCYDVCCS